MTQTSSCELLNHLISEIQRRDYSTLLASAEETYGVREFKISQITCINAFEIYNSVYTKAKKNQQTGSELNWWENELRIFIWILVCYMELRKVRIQELAQGDWEFFSRLFPNKQQILFEYQALSLLKENINTKKWATEQDEIFTNLIEQRGQKYKWSELAKQLYIASERQFFRTPKQCRERWLNHLDPNKSKQEWELKEDYILITHVRNKGKKWAEISKLLKNRRNEHSIKNRYKSLITKEEKLHEERTEQEDLLEQIYRKYENHFAKLRQTCPMISISAQTNSECSIEQEKKSNLPTAESISYANKRAFQFCPPSTSTAKVNLQTENQYPSLQLLEMPYQSTEYVATPFTSHSLSMNLLSDKQERQKQIRAEMFLSSDPFDFLRRFFKSKDQYQ